MGFFLRVPRLVMAATSAGLLVFASLAVAQEGEPAAKPAAPRSAATAIAPSGERPEGQPGQGRRPAPAPSQAGELHRLPPDSTTKQTLTLPGRTLNFTATAGSIRIYDGKGEPQADIAYTAYQLDGTEAKSRPVTFVFNGGPGSASAWLQCGNAGPWRLPMTSEAAFPSAPPVLVPNAETWLDFTDLVFIDPVGTGYSRFVATGDEVRKHFYSVDGDAASVAVTIRRWLEQANRMVSPKYILGESYGGIRGPRTVWNLQKEQGVGVSGLILVSPRPRLPRIPGLEPPAICREPSQHGGRDARDERPRDPRRCAGCRALRGVGFSHGRAEGPERPASARPAERQGRVPHRARSEASCAVSGRRSRPMPFGASSIGVKAKVTSAYDATVTGYDPFPDSYFSRFEDPLIDALSAPMTSAMVDLYEHRLNWKPDGHYELLSDAVNRSWNWGGGLNPPESLTQLRQALALDPKLKVLVAHGLFDLVTPYFGSKMELDQLPRYGSPDRVRLVVYPGGHMFYSRDASRAALRDEAKAMMSVD